MKGIPTAKPKDEVIWTDPILKIPFVSDPQISRLGGEAKLHQVLAYNLYYNDIKKKFEVLKDITISTVKNLARYYPIPPVGLTELGDYPMRLDSTHRLMTRDEAAGLQLADIRTQALKFQFDVSENLKVVDQELKLDKGYEFAEGSLGPSTEFDINFTAVDYLYEYITLRIINVTGANCTIKIRNVINDTYCFPIWASGAFSADFIEGIPFLPLKTIRITFKNTGTFGLDYQIYLLKEYRPAFAKVLAQALVA